MFELASLLFNFGFAIHCQTIGEKALRQSMSADNACRPLASAFCEFNDHAAVAN